MSTLGTRCAICLELRCQLDRMSFFYFSPPDLTQKELEDKEKELGARRCSRKGTPGRAQGSPCPSLIPSLDFPVGSGHSPSSKPGSGAGMKGQGWRMNGMLRAPALPPKPHKVLAAGVLGWEGAAQAFPRVPRQMANSSHIEDGFCPLQQPQPCPHSTTTAQLLNPKRGKNSIYFNTHTHTLTCTPLKVYIKYINT